MAQINTLLGPGDASKLGRTLMHEHVFVLSPEIEKWPGGQGVDPAEEWDEPVQRSRAIEKLVRRGELPRAILLSGGGNDVAGDEFVMLLEHARSAAPGLNEDVIRRLSAIKAEPEWLLEFRLKSYRAWLEMKEPTWHNLKINPATVTVPGSIRYVPAGCGGPSCPCDFNDDGVLNSQDFFDFLAAFFALNPSADFNNDGLVNSQDFFDFLACFFNPPGGC